MARLLLFGAALLAALVSPTSSGGAVRELAEAGHPLARPDDSAASEDLRPVVPDALDRIAQDLNALMTVVTAHAEILRKRRGVEAHQLEAIVEAGRRSSALAKELVMIARQKRGEDPQLVHTKMKPFASEAVRKSEPPRRQSEPPPGPGVAKASTPPAPLWSPASEPPISASRDSVPLYSERRVRAEHLNGTRGVILLVDDEELLLKTTRRMLEQRGFRVVTAGDGNRALELARTTPEVRLLLTDLSLPGMDGRELARRLRTTLPELRVLFMSGFDAVTSGLAAEGQPAEAFLSKPFSARELEEGVSALLAPPDSDLAIQQG